MGVEWLSHNQESCSFFLKKNAVLFFLSSKCYQLNINLTVLQIRCSGG